MRNFIVRIYRYEKDNPQKIVGVVEEPEIEGKRAFINLDELWGILNPMSRGETILGNDDNPEQ